jgi:altronate hydrolase
MFEGCFIRLSLEDNVFVLPGGGRIGAIFGNVTLRNEIPPCHKAAAEDIASGEPVIKYGCEIGVAARDIKRGDWVHGHNIYSKKYPDGTARRAWSGAYPHDRGNPLASYMGYRRRGKISPGVRNDLWVIPSAGCIAGELKYILSKYHKPYWIDAVRLLDCHFTCDGSTDADSSTDMILGFARNPNAAGILLVGLGCENMPISDIYNMALAEDCRVMCAILQKNSGDTVPRFLDDLAADSPRVREKFPLSSLRVGLLGARGGFSGITANPLLGMMSDRLSAQGATILASCAPELFDADDAISSRMTSKRAYEKFERAADAYDVQNSPSMDDWENGATTPEERALSAIPILGAAPVTNVLERGEPADTAAGIQITPGSPDDTVNCSVFAASGAQIVLYATSRGTPFGSVVPTIKISADSDTANSHPDWTDFDAGPIAGGESIDNLAGQLEERILRVACGEKTSHEIKGFGEIAIGR